MRANTLPNDKSQHSLLVRFGINVALQDCFKLTGWLTEVELTCTFLWQEPSLWYLPPTHIPFVPWNVRTVLLRYCLAQCCYQFIKNVSDMITLGRENKPEVNGQPRLVPKHKTKRAFCSVCAIEVTVKGIDEINCFENPKNTRIHPVHGVLVQCNTLKQSGHTPQSPNVLFSVGVYFLLLSLNLASWELKKVNTFNALAPGIWDVLSPNTSLIKFVSISCEIALK